jgi:hypothetical protein
MAGHFYVMSDEWDGDVYVVVATKGKKTEYWAVAVPRHRALAEVQKQLLPGWRAALSRRQLTRHERVSARYISTGSPDVAGGSDAV